MLDVPGCAARPWALELHAFGVGSAAIPCTRKKRVMKPWLLPSLCVAVLLLGLAGCSRYEPNIRTGAKKPPRCALRNQIAEDLL